MDIKYRNDLDKLLEYFELPKIILECGVAEGWFTKEILKWNFEKLYLVDAWKTLDQTGDGAYNQSWHDKNYAELTERIKPFSDRVEVLRGLSTEMASCIPDNTLGLAYIDACHEYECVLNDLCSYYPKIVKGGIIALHDVKNLQYGVSKAMYEFLYKHGYDNMDVNFTEEDGDLSNVSAWFIKK